MCQMQTIRSLCSRLSDRLTLDNTVRYSHNKDFHINADTTDRTEKQQ